MSASCIVVEGLSKRYGKRLAVSGLNLSVGCGQTFGFLGPNGAGKSTTIRMLLWLIRPSGGRIGVLGHDVRRERLAALRRVGAMVETPAFYGFLTARENVRLFGRLSGRVRESEITDALRLVGLTDRADDRVRSFSHGMRQRLGLACALTPRPELVILDEPTNGLDPEGVRDVREIVRTLSAEQGISVFLSSHLLHEVEQVCSHVAVIANGALLTSGDVGELLGRSSGELEIEVDRPLEAAAAIAVRFQLAADPCGDGRLLVRAERCAAADVNTFLVGQGFKVSAIGQRRMSLEDFYIALMGKGEQTT